MHPHDSVPDGELIILAQDVEDIAASINEPAIRDRLIEIADELVELARARELSR